MSERLGSLPRKLSVLLIAVLLGSAMAAAPTFGVSVSPFTGGWPAVTASAMYPFTTLQSVEGPVTLSGRLDVSAPLNLSSLPSVGLAATASFTGHGTIEPFFGAGAALAWYGSAGSQTAFVTPTLIAGARFPFDDTWSARVDIAAAPLVGGFSLGVGFEVSPW